MSDEPKGVTFKAAELTAEALRVMQAIRDAEIVEGPNAIWLSHEAAEKLDIHDGDEWVGKDGRWYRASTVDADDLP